MGSMTRQIRRQIERNRLRSESAPVGSFYCPGCGKRGYLTRRLFSKDKVKCSGCGYSGSLVKKPSDRAKAQIAEAKLIKKKARAK